MKKLPVSQLSETRVLIAEKVTDEEDNPVNTLQRNGLISKVFAPDVERDSMRIPLKPLEREVRHEVTLPDVSYLMALFG